MSNAEPADDLAEVLRAAARGAEQSLVRALVEAARTQPPHHDLVAVTTSALAAGTDRDDIIRACTAARLEIRTQAGASQNFEDPAEDHVLDPHGPHHRLVPSGPPPLNDEPRMARRQV